MGAIAYQCFQAVEIALSLHQTYISVMSHSVLLLSRSIPYAQHFLLHVDWIPLGLEDKCQECASHCVLLPWIADRSTFLTDIEEFLRASSFEC